MQLAQISMIRDTAKSDTLKGTDVFRSTDPNAIITSIYVKKGIRSQQITLTVTNLEL